MRHLTEAECEQLGYIPYPDLAGRVQCLRRNSRAPLICHGDRKYKELLNRADRIAEQAPTVRDDMSSPPASEREG